MAVVIEGFAAASILVLLFMTGLWCVQLKTKNAGIVDLGWTFSIFLMALACYVMVPGDAIRKKVIFIMVLLWAIRLLAHLTRRYIKGPGEDARYHAWRLEKGDHSGSFFLFVFLFQAVLSIILSIPFWIIASHSAAPLEYVEFFAILLWTIAFVGESLADHQLSRFKADPANRQQVCDVGLWNYSRHPNYFFECLIWVSYFILALGSPGGVWAILSPMLMIYFIVKVSGLPPAEEQSLRSKGDRYRAYQRTTSALIPWFKRPHS